MLDKLKRKILGKSEGKVNVLESPTESPPEYVVGNPMFPAKPSVYSSHDTIGFLLGTDYPKVTKSPKKKVECESGG